VSAKAPNIEVSADAPPKKKSKKLLWIVLAVVLLGAGGGAGWFFMAPKHDKAAEEAEAAAANPAQYFALTPAFVVNLADSDTTRYLQADVQLMTHDEETKKALELHAPALRNRLLLLFSSQHASELSDRKGKEKLQQAALAEVRAVLKAQKVKGTVDALYFTSLVTQ